MSQNTYSLGTVWEALDDAAGVLFDTTVGTTNIVIEHKYGSNVAEAVVDSCLIGRDVYVTATSVKALKPSAITKNFAKTTVSIFLSLPLFLSGEGGWKNRDN